MTELDIAFQNALTHLPHDYVKAKALLAEGANINATDDYGDSIINECLFSCADRITTFSGWWNSLLKTVGILLHTGCRQ